MKKKLGKKAVSKINQDNENGARRKLVEELFYDFNRSQVQVYWVNLVRGIFFGFGTVLGGTILVAIMVWLLSQFVDWFPFIGDFVQQIFDAVQSAK